MRTRSWERNAGQSDDDGRIVAETAQETVPGSAARNVSVVELIAASDRAVVPSAAVADACSCIGCTTFSIPAFTSKVYTPTTACTGGQYAAAQPNVASISSSVGFKLYTVNDANLQLYSQGRSFSYLTAGSSSVAVSCFEGLSWAADVSSTILHVIVQCQNQASGCTLEQDILFTCLGGSTPTPTVTTAPPGQSSGSYSCSCQCCKGNYCNAYTVGSRSVSSCGSCSSEFCYEQFPSSCPVPSGTGQTVASCALSGDSGGLSIGMIVGIVLVVLVVILLIVIGVLVYNKRKSAHTDQQGLAQSQSGYGTLTNTD